MFWRRREPEPPPPSDEPADTPSDEPVVVPPTTVARPRREAAGMGLRARPSGLGSRLRSILGAGTPATDATWDEVEETLIAGDVGAATTLEVVDAARQRMEREGGRTGEDARRALATELRDRLAASGSGVFELGPAPSVILVVGVNGTGKTTTIAKLAHRLKGQGRSLALAAGDTFRAAAVEQLRIWGEEIGVPVVAQRTGADPGAVAFDAVAAAESRNLDAVLVDTAGRLQNKQQLMDELAKIRRVIERRLPGQPRHVLLVLDATTGQNGLVQAEAFSREVGITGIVLTKLDGTAKGGVALAVADRLGVPILFAGVGEELDALAPFEPEAFVEWLFAE
ncbi:MAG: signal recognition particle-docking protein FtsY [Chloroflexi bacterium]|nr:signal recognition particle-docking protein FtsY [Chloroflexota bacterium]